MPVSRLDQRDYPGGSLRSPEWLAIRARILEREQHRCKVCRVPDRVIIWRDAETSTFMDSEGWIRDRDTGEAIRLEMFRDLYPWIRQTKVILTVAHLDHDKRNNADANLAALCQLHHLRLDRPRHVERRRLNRLRKLGMPDMFEANL